MQEQIDSEIFNSPTRKQGMQKTFEFTLNSLARQRIGRKPTVEFSHVPLHHKVSLLKRQNSSPTKIASNKKRRGLFQHKMHQQHQSTATITS